jgi:protein ImuB
MCSTMIVCVLLPRFPLTVAAADREALLREPAALAPEPGREQMIGEVSPAAETFGVRPGMRMGEALARCPRLQLISPDPVGVADAWEGVLVRLESIGAAVESVQPGQALFDARGLRRLHGGHVDGVLAATRTALRRPARLGAGPTRFVALAAAASARPRRPRVVEGAQARAFLAEQPVGLLRHRASTERLPEQLERLGLSTLGDVAALPRDALADRFGGAGVHAHELACGEDAPVRPRVAGERLEESLDLPDAGNGQQLERALALLIDRLLARRERRGRTSAPRSCRPCWSRAAPGASGSSSARPPRTPRGCAWHSAASSRCCPRRPRRCACRPTASARRTASATPCSTTARPSGATGCARRSARPAPRRSRRRAARARGRSGLARARAKVRPDALRGMTGPKRLNVPQRARVQAGDGGRPLAVDGRAVDAVRESWLVEDRWWTDTPLRRRYWEVVTVDGRNLVVFAIFWPQAGTDRGDAMPLAGLAHVATASFLASAPSPPAASPWRSPAGSRWPGQRSSAG